MACLAVLVGLTVVLLWPGHTPPITDASGKVLPGSVAALERVPLNETRQWVLMRGHSERLPVLLFLSGGPGGTEMGWVRAHNAELEKHFIVAVWEQPGVGKSYPLAFTHREHLTLDQYVEDGLALAEYLKRRFHQDKIFLMGHSWGSFLGVWMAQRRPDLFHAYIGVGQMTSTVQDDRLGYRYVLEHARAEGKLELVRKLERQGPPPYSGSLILLRYMTYLNPLTAYEHGLIRRAGGGGGNTFGEMVSLPELRVIDKLYAFLGLIHTFSVVYPQLNERQVDLAQQATDFEVPVYFLIGRHDLNAMASLSERYFERIRAPHKELIWFGRSGHNPNYGCEADLFTRTVIERFRPLAFPSRGPGDPRGSAE
ncbi:alpha/beta fold hydrolase [Deinococcus planocerae]|uniref:alpha/beta fold hydrolase n=1 Tax=Deinococcus planocerae TaxID=1737569 RepID=UPI0015E0B994|nr:alpha/beta hydrolase [Deinococcus planocerae]